ncbi:hypothetical protein KAW65_08070 [candidate division WOR-3 bacterium]|nr:hypothetical protein [candidate division WOR-3 bacterium]
MARSKTKVKRKIHRIRVLRKHRSKRLKKSKSLEFKPSKAKPQKAKSQLALAQPASPASPTSQGGPKLQRGVAKTKKRTHTGKDASATAKKKK